MNKMASVMLVLACTLSGILLILSFDESRNYSESPAGQAPQDYNSGWNLTVEDDEKGKVSLPCKTGAKAGQTFTLTREIPPNFDVSNWLSIRTNQHFVRAYINDVMVYSYGYNSASVLPFAAAPGNVWNFIPISQSGTLRIEFYSPFSSHAGVANTALVGSWGALWRSRLQMVLPTAMVSFASMLIGVLLILIGLYLKRSVGGSMAYLGLFCLVASIWSLIQSRAPDLLVSGGFAVSQLGYLCLLACPFPLLMFMRGYLGLQNHRTCKVLLIAGGALAVMVLTLYILGVATIVHLLIVIMLIIVAFAVYIMLMVVIHTSRANTPGRALLVFAFISLVVGALADLVNTRFFLLGRPLVFTDSAYFFRMGFVLFVLLLTVLTARQGIHVYSRGLEADMLQKMMETDIMTGLYNRQTYDLALEEIYAKGPPRGMAMVLLDMNNLKIVNDKQGHKVGDKLIQITTQLMHESFSLYGRCYRIGGDEFIVLIPDISSEDLNIAIQVFHKKVREFNALGGLKIDVAIGHDFYSDEWDKDVYALFTRVDGAMYQDKRETKSSTHPPVVG